jgi:hypothetical protein
VTRALSHLAGLFALAGILITGCRTETFVGWEYEIDAEQFNVVSGAPLAGQVLRVSAPWLASAPDTIAVQIDGRVPQEATRSDASYDVFELLLPSDLPGGEHSLSLLSHGPTTTEMGRFESGGFDPAIRHLPTSRLIGSVQTLATQPTIVGVEFFTDQLKVLDLRTGVETRLEEFPTSDSYGLGSTASPNMFVLSDAPNHFRIGVGATGPWIDTLPFSCCSERAHELAPNLVLEQSNSWSYFTDQTPGEFRSIPLDWYGHSDRVQYSPDGRWAVPDHSGSENGVLVVDRFERSFRWIPGWRRARTLILGDTSLIVFGGDWGESSPRLLHRVDLASLTVRAETTLTPGPAWLGMPGLVGGGRFVAVPRQVVGGWEVSLHDPQTLTEIGKGRSPTISGACLLNGEPWVVDDPTRARFYVIDPYCHIEAGIPIATFLLP